MANAEPGIGDNNECSEIVKLWDDCECILPELCDEIDRLFCRPAGQDSNRQKMNETVHPKTLSCKPSEIARLDQLDASHLDELSYTPVRKLIQFRERVKKLYPQGRLEILNGLIQHSLFSVYTRLYRSKNPAVPILNLRKNRSQHSKLCKQLSKTKIPLDSEFSNLLATPEKKPAPTVKVSHKEKKHVTFTVPEGTPSPPAEILQPTERVFRLVAQKLSKELPKSVLSARKTCNYVSPRMKLSKVVKAPNTYANGKERKNKQFGVSFNKTSSRIKKLAKPRKHVETNTRPYPHMISKAALNAIATPRTLELSQPRKRVAKPAGNVG